MVEDLDDVVIRPATVQDAEQIARVHVASWREAYAGVVAEEYLARLDPDSRARTWAEQIADAEKNGVAVWVAQDDHDDRVVGFASIGPSRDEDADRSTLEIYTIYLEPASWGQGVARRLLRAVLEPVPEGTKVTLWVMAANARAQHFYRRNGFVADGVERVETFGDEQLREVRYCRG